jgi:cysteine desulfurase
MKYIKQYFGKKMKYLNYNSTNPDQNIQFNYSDKSYDINVDLREKIDTVKQYILNLFNLKHGKVIFTSGATESCATCMHWIKEINDFGYVYGSEFDHDSVRLNAENYHLNYKQIDTTQDLIEFPSDCAALWITHVNPKSGEIYPIQNLIYNSTPYEPFIIADVTQSIGKVPLDMKKSRVDAAYFSLHKIGGPMNYGVLVISNRKEFKPLIAGYQQETLRGGTMDMLPYDTFIETYEEFSKSFDIGKCKKLWNRIVNKCQEYGLKIYEPKYGHLYNTVLIPTYHCNLQLIYDLSCNDIYVGSTSACLNDSKYVDPNIRLSFINGKGIDDQTIDTILKAIVKSNEENAKED